MRKTILPIAYIRSVLPGYHSAGALANVAHQFDSPEDINTGKATAPSKRLQTLGANYGKVAHGARIAARIGIAAMRAACPHFNDWMCRIESLS